jgi:uncharacterized membrane protein YkvA (DUF1232 family)
MLQEVQPEVDLLDEFWNSYLINSTSWDSDSNLLSAIRKINQHVLLRGGYATLDLYLAATGTKVYQTWADLCLEAGYTISPDNIVPDPVL